MEFRPNQKASSGYFFVQPFFLFEGFEIPNTTIKLSINETRSGANFSMTTSTPNEDFMGTQPQTNFINQDSIFTFVVDGCLTLHIEFDMKIVSTASDSRERVLQDLGSIVGDDSLSDFTYHVSDRDFAVHKIILAGE